MKYNDFAGVQQKTPATDAAGPATPVASTAKLVEVNVVELPAVVKDSRRKRSFNKNVDQTPDKPLVEGEMKRTRLKNVDGESSEPRSSKRKLVLQDEDHAPDDSPQTAPDTKTNRLKRVGPRGKSVAPVETTVADDSASERQPKRRRTMAPLTVDEADSTHEDKDDDFEQPTIRKRGRGRESKSATKLREGATTASQEAVAAPARRGRRPNKSIVVSTPVVTVESDTQSETTINETRGKKVSARTLRLVNRADTSTPRGRRSSRSLNAQEPVLDSPLTANDEVSGDESVKSVAVVRRGRGRRPRGRPATLQQSSKAKADIVVSDDDDDEGEISSGMMEMETKMGKAKIILADIFTKKGMKKRKRISPTIVKPGARASSRIAAVTLAASSPNSYGGASSDEQQPTAKKQMTLPEMLRMKQTRSRENSMTATPVPVAPDVCAAPSNVSESRKDDAPKVSNDGASQKSMRECATPVKESAAKVIATTPKLRGKRNGAQNEGKPLDEYSAEADDEMEEDIKLSNRKALIQMSNVVVSLKDINVDKKFVEGAPIKTTSLISCGQGSAIVPAIASRPSSTLQPQFSAEKANSRYMKNKATAPNPTVSAPPLVAPPVASKSEPPTPVKEADGKSASDRQLAAVAKKTKKSKIVEVKEIEEPVMAVPPAPLTTISPPPVLTRTDSPLASIQPRSFEKKENLPKIQTDQAPTKDAASEAEPKPNENVSAPPSSTSKEADQVVNQTEKQIEISTTTVLPVEPTKVMTSPTTKGGDVEKPSVPEQTKSPPKPEEIANKSEDTKSLSPLKKSPTKLTDKWTADSLDDCAAAEAEAVAKAAAEAAAAAAVAPPENTTSVLKFNENYKSASVSPPKPPNVKRPSVESRPNVIVDAPSESLEKSVSSAPTVSTVTQESNAKTTDTSTLPSAETNPGEANSADKKTEPFDKVASDVVRKGKVYKISDSESECEIDGNKTKPLKTAEAKVEEPAERLSGDKQTEVPTVPTTIPTVAPTEEKLEKWEKSEKAKETKKSVIKSVYESTSAPSVEATAAKNDSSSPPPSAPPPLKQSKSMDFGQKALPIETNQPATTSRKNPAKTDKCDANPVPQPTKPMDETKPTQPPSESKPTDAHLPIKSETNSIQGARSQEPPPSKRMPKDRSDAAKAFQPSSSSSKGQNETRKSVSSSCSQTTMSQTDIKRESKFETKTTQSSGAGIENPSKKFEPPNKRDGRQSSSSAANSLNNASGSTMASSSSSKNSHNDAPALMTAGAMNNSSKSMANASMGGGGGGGSSGNRPEKHHSKNSQDKMASSMGTMPPQFPPMNQLPNYHHHHNINNSTTHYWQWDSQLYGYHTGYNLLDAAATQKSPTKFHKDLANTMYGHGLPSNYLTANAQSQQGAGVGQQQSSQEHQQQSYQQSAAGPQSIQQQSWSNYQNLGVINAEVSFRNPKKICTPFSTYANS